MKKTMLMIAIAALAAGSAFAEEGHNEGPGCPQGKKAWDRDGGGKPSCCQMDKRGGKDRPGGPMDPAMMEQMKADHKAIKELGEAARAETDEAKKAELVGQLRAKLGEVADRMQAHREQRLADIQAQADERIAQMKARFEEDKANRDSRIEEQVQRILSGERPERPAAFDRFPNAKGGKGEYRDDDQGRRGHGRDGRGEDDKDMPAPPPPPAGEEMPGEMAPPPAE